MRLVEVNTDSGRKILMINVLKRMAAYLPDLWLGELKRFHYRREIRLGRFSPDEPEEGLLDSYIDPGDWVIDVGANIGHYSKRFSELVGKGGRVIAMEPTPRTFALLAANANHFAWPNVTLLNLAASNQVREVGIEVPDLPSGMKNYYMAHVGSSENGLRVTAIPLDNLGIKHRVSLVKIDVEGHESEALRGMKLLIERDKPVLIVETHSSDVTGLLTEWGYACERLEASPNVFCLPREHPHEIEVPGVRST